MDSAAAARNAKKASQLEYAEQIRLHSEQQSQPTQKESYARQLENDGNGRGLPTGREVTNQFRRGFRDQEKSSNRVLGLGDEVGAESPRGRRGLQALEKDSARVLGRGNESDEMVPRGPRNYKQANSNNRIFGSDM